MMADGERIGRIRQALEERGLDAVVCSLPSNVLLLTGYWPVVGTAIAVATRRGAIGLLAPKDERHLAEAGWADELRLFEPGSLEELRNAAEAVHQPLAMLLQEQGIERGRVGCETGPAFQPSSYASLHLYGASLGDVLAERFPAAVLVSADELLARLRSVPTAQECARVRTACAIAGSAFESAAATIRAGMRETEVAARFRTPLSTPAAMAAQVERADGFAFCMSGANAAHAYGAYARSRAKVVAAGELLLVHCNSYADGYWSDITRTYSLGEPDARQCRMYRAVFAARDAAFAVIRPGVRAADVDRAARGELEARGFGAAFKHPTGHGVGFAAIDHNAPPRLHPRSDDVLEPGMVFNVEPAIYLDDLDGLRQCDMVVVTETGASLLTPFHVSLEELTLDA